MKKSLLSILIALVLIVALLPIVASADPATAGVNINGAVQTVTQGEAALYFTTDTAGAITAGGNEDTYNIKFVFPEGTDAVPTVYLRGAYIVSDIKSDATSAATTKIIVEDTDAGKVTTAAGDVDTDSIVSNIKWDTKDLVIEGPGKLTFADNTWITFTTGGYLTFNNLDLVINSTGTGSRGVSGPVTGITFNGGNYNMTTGYATIFATAGLADDIVITGNANVTINSFASHAIYATGSEAGMVLESGNFKGTACTSGKLVAQLGAKLIVMNGGTIELENTAGATGNSGAKIDFTNYNGTAVGTSYFTTAGAAMGSYNNNGNLGWYKYVKVEPGYAVTANNGKSYRFNNPDDVQSTFTAGMTVYLTCDASDATKEFEGWVVDEGSTAVTITDADKTTASFVMPEGNVSVTAKYKKLVAEATVKIDGTDYTVDQGGDALYFTTDDAGAVTAGGDESTYNMKLVYAEGENAVPTLYLKGATIGFPINSVKSDKFVIKVETDSTQSGAMITWSHGELIVEGSEGAKYTIDSAKTAFKLVGSPITFKNLDITANITADWNYVIGGNPKLITFSGGKADFAATTACIFNADAANEDMEGLVVTDNADVKMGGSGSAIYWDVKNAGVTVNSGKLHMYTTRSGGTPFRLLSKKFVINGGSVELDGQIASYPYSIVPDLSGYQGNYTAVTGEKNGLIPYDPEDGFGQGVDGGYRGYWKIEPAEAGHQCSLKMVKGKAASCTADGEKFYYACEECGAAYEDNLGEKPIEDIDTWKVIKAFGHTDDDKDGKCDVCQAVQTSDSSFTALWIAVLALSVLGICVTFVYNKKKVA